MSIKKFILILFAISLSSGFFWTHKMFGSPLHPSDDSYDYNVIALNILDGKNFAPSSSSVLAAYEPLYPFFLTGVYKIFGRENFNAVRVLQIIIFYFCALLAYFIARKVVGERGGRASGALTALFFPLASSAGYLHREALFTFLILLLVFLFYKWQEVGVGIWPVLTGFTLGLLVLLNSVTQFLFLFLLFGSVVIYGREILKTRNVILTLFFLLSFFSVLYLWPSSSANAEESGSIGLKLGGALSRKAEIMRELGGEKYARHLGGQLFGYYFVEKDGFDPSEILGHPKTTEEFQGLLSSGYSVKEASDMLARENFKYIISHPVLFAKISTLDFLQLNGPMLFNPRTLQAMPMQNLFIGNSYSGLAHWQKVSVLAVLRVLYWIFFGFVLYGFFRAVKNWRSFIWILTVVIYFNFVYTAVFGLPRYAIPIYPFYIILLVLGAGAFLNFLNLQKAKNSNIVSQSIF